MVSDARVFLDTNVIVYANEGFDANRQHRAIDVIGDLMRSGVGG